MYRKIVVGYNGSEQGEDALALASRLRDPSGTVIAACIYPATGPGRGAQLEPVLAEEAVKTLKGSAHVNDAWLELEAAPGHSAAHGLHLLSERTDADLVVVGSSHRGPAGRVLAGTTADRLLNGSPCPVAVAPVGYAKAIGSLGTIGLAYDGSESAAAALPEAAALASSLDARLQLFAVVPPLESVWTKDPTYTHVYSGAEVLEYRRHEFERMLRSGDGDRARGPARPPPRCSTVMRRNGSLDQAGEQVDLLVMGSRNYGPLRRVMVGSTAVQVMRDAPCPVIVIPRGAPTPSAPTAREGAAAA